MPGSECGIWPWMASLGYFKDDDIERKTWTHQCGATIITDKHILTAAHCAKDDRYTAAVANTTWQIGNIKKRLRDAQNFSFSETKLFHIKQPEIWRRGSSQGYNQAITLFNFFLFFKCKVVGSSWRC